MTKYGFPNWVCGSSAGASRESATLATASLSLPGTLPLFCDVSLLVNLVIGSSFCGRLFGSYYYIWKAFGEGGGTRPLFGVVGDTSGVSPGF